MLRPQDSATRETKRLDGMWRFALDPTNTGVERSLFAGPLPGRRQMAVPASVNDLIPDERVRNHVGLWWYQRTVRVPRGWTDQEIVLRFGSATHHARVWVDDAEVGAHKGGYLPFEFEISDLVTPGETFRLTVAVNNRLDNSCIPPGHVTELPDGRRVQHYLHDFYNYSGLHRHVDLFSRPRTHVSDITVTTDYRETADGRTGTVEWAVETTGSPAEVHVAVVDRRDGATVAIGEGSTGSLEIADVTLWTPGHGGLYDLRVELVDEQHAVVDEYRQPFGVRTVAVEGSRVLINGEPFYFTGFGMHEDHETLGKAHSDAHLLQDAELLAWVGANSLRTSHYPYAEEFMDYCDEHGIVVIDETPAVGLNWSMEGGILDSDGGPTYAEGHVDATTQAQHRADIEALVARDKNRPCVVLWSIANEPDSAVPEARDYFAPLVEATRAADPTRPVGFANVMFAPYNKDTISDLFDVLMLNRYFGWYLDHGDLRSAEQHLRAEIEGWVDRFDKPIIMTEYGADTVAGLHSVFDQPFTEDYQLAYLEMSSRIYDDYQQIIGEQMWNFADFQTKYGVARVDGNRKGAFTRARRPKAAARYLRQRWIHLPQAQYGQRAVVPELDDPGTDTMQNGCVS